MEAWAPDLEQLFEEAASALAEVSADYPDAAPPARADRPARVTVAADDLEGLAFAWLNELIGLADSRHAALVRTSVARVQESGPGADAAWGSTWRLAGRAWLSPFGPGAARARRGVKSATFHRLAVARTPAGWRLRAYLDV